MNEFLFAIVLFLSNAMQTITGFAGTALAMPASMLLIGIDNARVVLNITTALTCLLIWVQNRQDTNYHELAKIIGFMLIGMIAGLEIYKLIPSDGVLIIYAIVVILVGVKNLIIQPDNTKKLHEKFLIFILLLAGVIHGMFVAGGTLLVIYAMLKLKDKEEFRATIAPVWVVLNAIMLVFFWQDGTLNAYSLEVVAYSIIPLALSIVAGNILVKRINQKTFLTLTYVLLIVSGISLLI